MLSVPAFMANELRHQLCVLKGIWTYLSSCMLRERAWRHAILAMRRTQELCKLIPRVQRVELTGAACTPQNLPMKTTSVQVLVSEGDTLIRDVGTAMRDNASGYITAAWHVLMPGRKVTPH